MEEKDYFKEGEFAGWIGVIGNILLTAAKFVAGTLSNSTAMIADSLHSASDIIASLVVILSLKITKKPPDQEHPYGHGKAESISTGIIGVFLLIAGFLIAYSAFKNIISGDLKAPGVLALWAAILSIAVKELMFQYTYRIGKKIQSPSTIANAWDHRSDAYSSIAALIGIVGARAGITILDPIAGIAVTLFIIKMGYGILKEGLTQVMDGLTNVDVLENVENIARECSGVIDVKGVKARQSGPYIFIDLKICVDRSSNLEEAHEVAVRVKNTLLSAISNAKDVLIHIDPIDPVKKEVL